MSEPVRWRRDIARDDLPHFVQQLEWSLQHQNQRIAKRLQPVPDAVRAKILLVGPIVGMLSIAWLFATDPSSHDHGWYFAGFAFFAFALVLGRARGRMRAWSRRTAGRLLARRAERLLRGLARVAPTAIEYELAASELRVSCAELPKLTPIALAGGLLIATRDCAFVFRGRLSPRPKRTIYLGAEPDRRALLDAFARGGAEIVELAGPSEGYADPLPPAKAVR